MLSPSAEGIERELAGMDYTNPVGSTVTAMGDSFQQFGYWGCCFFAAMGMFFRKLWHAARRPHALFAQLLYMQSCTCAMRAVTHWTLDFLPGLLYNVVFLGVAVLYASDPIEFGRGAKASPSPRLAAPKPRAKAGLPRRSSEPRQGEMA
jgi:hypothetical protein